jgi:hypothetical protein
MINGPSLNAKKLRLFLSYSTFRLLFFFPFNLKYFQYIFGVLLYLFIFLFNGREKGELKEVILALNSNGREKKKN